ncbi:rhodopsin, GQ-coupled-like [Rhopilema esculentum]|uniref:rhodopsin, GQ-coupled-like n=1 Tax=Rhopilema esculentum TaxID=499914 RepID=UPI0031D3681E|eukprot:gene9702-18170_t
MDLSFLSVNFTGNFTNLTKLTLNLTIPRMTGILLKAMNITIGLGDWNLFPAWGFAYIYPVMVTIGICISVLNIYILVLFKRKPLLRSKSNYFLLHLATFDAINGVICVPLFVASEKLIERARYSTFVQAMCVYQITLIILRAVNILAIITLFMIITDRCLNLWFPFRYRQFKTWRKIHISLFVAWLFPVLFTTFAIPIYLPMFRSWKLSTFVDIIKLSTIILEVSITLEKYKYREVFYCSLVLSTIFSSISLCLIFVAIYKRPRILTSNSRAFMSSTRRKRELKAFRVLCIMFLTILVWLVPTVYAFVGGQERLHYVVFHLGRFLISITNPILFTIHKTDFQKAVYQDIIFLKSLAKCFQANVSANMVSPRQSQRERSKARSAFVTHLVIYREYPRT